MGASQTLEAMVAMFATGDLSALSEVVDAEYVDHQGLDGTPLHGPAGFALVVRTARGGYRVLDVATVDQLEDGNRAAGRLRWCGVRPSGEVVERETVEIIHVRDGRAVEHWGGHCHRDPQTPRMPGPDHSTRAVR